MAASGIGNRNRNGDLVLIGADELMATMASLMMKDRNMERAVRKLIKKVLQKARTKSSRDVRSQLPSDPRQAYRAVKHSVYKAVFGGNISILSKKRRGKPTSYVKPRTLAAGQRGGNRRKRSERTEQLESYGNSDRGFVLRFLDGGTEPRHTKYGNRGSISARRVFSRTAESNIEKAADELAAGIRELINIRMNE